MKPLREFPKEQQEPRSKFSLPFSRREQHLTVQERIHIKALNKTTTDCHKANYVKFNTNRINIEKCVEKRCNNLGHGNNN